jgi:hypothetical protein
LFGATVGNRSRHLAADNGTMHQTGVEDRRAGIFGLAQRGRLGGTQMSENLTHKKVIAFLSCLANLKKYLCVQHWKSKCFLSPDKLV